MTCWLFTSYKGNDFNYLATIGSDNYSNYFNYLQITNKRRKNVWNSLHFQH